MQRTALRAAADAERSHRFAARTLELPDWPAPLRGANQSFDLTF
jgi:hypothetical protein